MTPVLVNPTLTSSNATFKLLALNLCYLSTGRTNLHVHVSLGTNTFLTMTTTSLGTTEGTITTSPSATRRRILTKATSRLKYVICWQWI